MFREIKTNIALYSAHRSSDVKAEHGDQYIQSEQRNFAKRQAKTEARETQVPFRDWCKSCTWLVEKVAQSQFTLGIKLKICLCLIEML